MTYKIKAEEYLYYDPHIISYFNFKYSRAIRSKLFKDPNQRFNYNVSSCYKNKLFLCKNLYHMVLFNTLCNRIAINRSVNFENTFYMDFLD